MPISSSNPSTKLKVFSTCAREKSAKSKTKEKCNENQFLTIAPALPVLPETFLPSKLPKHSLNKFRTSSSSSYQLENDQVGGCNVVTLQQAEEGKFVVASRSPSEREKNPDRICLDRRGLTSFPWIIDEPRLRLMSLQHNLISKMEHSHLTQLSKLVFLDLYDNQIEKFCCLDPLENLRVLLMGKNKIKKIEGLKSLTKLEVLDLHGNQIMQVSGLEESSVLKVLNLAGNNIKTIGPNDFLGLTSLKELNLRRNKIKKILGLDCTPQLQKLYLSNNDIQRIEDMGSVSKAVQIKEISIDGNPVTHAGECVSFLVSFLPNLQILSTMQVNEQIRRTALAWRALKEQSNSAFLDLNAEVCVNARREEVISNAKMNWEFLRSQRKQFTNSTTTNKTLSNVKNELTTVVLNRSLATTKSNDIEVTKQNLMSRSKSKTFGSLTCINETCGEGPKKFCKSKSNSSDSLIKIVNPLREEDALEFKLPPILAPIIDNLTNCQIGSSTASVKISSSEQDVSESSESDQESAESHLSLKNGLRSHLIKSTLRSLSSDFEVDDNANTFVASKRYGSMQNTTNLANQEKFENQSIATIQSLKAQESQLELKLKSITTRSKLDSSFKGNSLDSNRSTLGDSSSSSISSMDKTRAGSAQIRKVVHYRSNRAATARARHKVTPIVTPPPQPAPPRDREQGGDYLVEIVGRCLNVYGQGALRCIDKQWDTTKADKITTVKFNYVQFNGIATILGKLKQRFPNAEHYSFRETNISHLGQLNALAEAQGLNSIQIEAEGNPIISKNWKVYATFRLAHWGLQTINEIQITDEDVDAANREYAGLADMVMWSLPESLLQPLIHRLHLDRVQKQSGHELTAKQFLFNCDPALRNVVAKEALQWRRGNVTQDDLIWRHKGKIHLSRSIDSTVDAIQKLQILDEEWPKILYELVHKTLTDYSDMSGYMKRLSKELEKK
ncbi:hypothetical protein QAD02_001543 [Eretmocerus hayati]|uniref:Uncharacterized protein n=1 Tax=Eretmocerus hayati TaxID=131215 RepID=A0ACC2NGA1_9HYME|nr:hypothetical protein QAD02_001543 [Eretmocerus hayati]